MSATLMRSTFALPRSKPAVLGRDSVLELAFAEYCDLCEAGDVPDVGAFCERFPGYEGSLARLIAVHADVHAWVQEHKDWTDPAVAGSLLDAYQIVQRLGSGSFAEVYLARERALGNRLVVLKLSRVGQHEARIQGQLDHPNIVPVLSLRHDPGKSATLLCMPYLGHATLRELLDRLCEHPQRSASNLLQTFLDENRRRWEAESGRTLPKPAAPRSDYVHTVHDWARQLADALATLHAGGFAHRDLKPSNVLISAHGAPVLLDFNLAHSERSDSAPPCGTLPYMAPELLANLLNPQRAGQVDSRKADQFAFGLVIAELLLGQHPFLPEHPEEAKVADLAGTLLKRIQGGLPELRRGSRCLQRIVRRCLAVDPAERYADFAEVRNELEQLEVGSTRLRKFVVGLPLVLAFALASLALSAWTLPANHATRETLDRAMAHQEFDRACEIASLMLQSTPDDADLLYLRARALISKGDPETAITDLHRSVRQKPVAKRMALLAYLMGSANLNNPRGMKEWAEKAIEAGWECPRNYNNLGRAYLQLNAPLTAMEYFDRAIELDSNFFLAYRNRARCAVHLAVNGKSLEDLDLDWARKGISDLQIAARGIDSGGLHSDLALLYSVLARDDYALQDQVIHHVAAAVSRGIESSMFPVLPTMSHFRNHPAFQAALEAPPIPNAVRKVPKLVPPFLDS